MEKGVLTIKGERNGEARDIRKHYKRAERAWGAFYRRFSLPDTADPERITAKTANGVLEVNIPKRIQEQPRKIVVES
jgi:HSP20 family protein